MRKITRNQPVHRPVRKRFASSPTWRAGPFQRIIGTRDPKPLTASGAARRMCLLVVAADLKGCQGVAGRTGGVADSILARAEVSSGAVDRRSTSAPFH